MEKNDIDKFQSKLKKWNLIADGKGLNLFCQRILLQIRGFDYLQKI
jgi:hypothetical protein